ncbi:hypothetical protein QQG55_38310 [Brugia pahangi]
MDAQKVAINKESEFKLTRDELEHIAHVSYMAEEEFGKFQTKLPIDKDWVEEEGTKNRVTKNIALKKVNQRNFREQVLQRQVPILNSNL